MSSKKTSLGVEEHIAVAISYALGWLSGLIVLLVEKENTTVRYHAAQSLLVFGVINVLTLLLPYFMLFNILLLLVNLLNLVMIALWIAFIIMALKKTPLKLKFLSEHVESVSSRIK